MTSFDEATAHRHFAVDCFNRAWSLLDQESRHEDEAEEMLHLAHASLWHWTQVPDHTPTNLSIGRWQLARVYAVAQRPGEALRWAERCREGSEEADLPSFYRGYAYEALARAAASAGREEEAARYLERARELAAEVQDDETRELLLADLGSL